MVKALSHLDKTPVLPANHTGQPHALHDCGPDIAASNPILKNPLLLAAAHQPLRVYIKTHPASGSL